MLGGRESRWRTGCELPRAGRLGRVALWVATVVAAIFLGFPYLAGILIS